MLYNINRGCMLARVKNNLYFCTQIIQELFEKRDEYGSARQSYFFLSIANSHVSSS